MQCVTQNMPKQLKTKIIFTRKRTLTCTHLDIISAIRDKDFTGYAPFSEGSTILDSASIS